MNDDVKKPLGRILLKQQAVTQSQLERGLAQSRQEGVPLATSLAQSGAVSEIAAIKALSEQSGVPGIDLSRICIRLAHLALVPREIAVRHRLLPVLVREGRVFVAMATPGEKKVIDEIEFVTGLRVFPYVALSGPLLRAIAVAYDMREQGDAFYAGPSCPPEVLRKAGFVKPAAPRSAEPVVEGGSLPTPNEPEPEPELGLERLSAEAPPPLVVDDAMHRMGSEELHDSDFGEAAGDLSVVAELPREPLPPGTPRLLIVDDEPDIRKMLRRVFEERGFAVDEADRGQVALRLVKESPPDVMILDAMLPEVHGFDIARRMKGTERYGHIPIIMISAVYRGWRYAEDLKSSYGVEAYIEKPFRVADVVAAVDRALAQSARTPAGLEKRTSAEAERLLEAGIAAYRAGETDQAIEHLKAGTEVDPLAFRLHFHLGLLYGKEGLVYEAIQAIEASLQINNRHFPALKNLAVLYQKAGFRNKAVETWERALGVAPDDPTRRSIKEHLLGLL